MSSATDKRPILYNDALPTTYSGADKSLARPTYRFIFLMVKIFLFMLVLFYIYINSTNIPPIMIINRIYVTQSLLSL